MGTNELWHLSWQTHSARPVTSLTTHSRPRPQYVLRHGPSSGKKRDLRSSWNRTGLTWYTFLFNRCTFLQRKSSFVNFHQNQIMYSEMAFRGTVAPAGIWSLVRFQLQNPSTNRCTNYINTSVLYTVGFVNARLTEFTNCRKCFIILHF